MTSGRPRIVAVAIAAMLILLTGVPDGAPFGVSAAQAQAQDQRGGLLRFLFPRNQPQPQVQEPQRRQPQRQRVREPRRQGGGQAQRRKRQSAPAQAVAAAPAVTKADDARTVLVVGDFVAGGLAEGLEAAFEADASVAFVSRSNGSSGLVRDDYFDWPGSIGPMIDEAKPAAVIVMLGSNDRQALSVGGQSQAPRTDAWLAEYERRATLVAKAVTDEDVPLIWVGMVPFRPSTMSADMIAFNDIYRKVAESAGGEFIDVWDGFVDENGAFVQSGPDMNGQPTQLRADDGINITRAGKRKIAFFVEKSLLRVLGNAPQPELVFFGPELPEGFGEGPRVAPRIDRTQPVALFGAEPADSELIGRIGIRPARPAAAAAEGEQPTADIAPMGRADNFKIRPPAASTPTPASREVTGALR